MSTAFDYNSAIAQCNKVSAAYQECEEARKSLQSVKQAISESWRGDSGAAMYAALEQWEQKLLSTMSKLNALSNSMRQVATNYQQAVVSEKSGE